MLLLSFLFHQTKSLETWTGLTNVSQYNMTQGTSLAANATSTCPCETNNYTCIPNCCCSEKCASFYNQTDSNCYPVPSTALVQMCDSFSKDEVGSVSNWLMRTIFCVYRENNPLTKRGETFATPDTNYEATQEQIDELGEKIRAIDRSKYSRICFKRWSFRTNERKIWRKTRFTRRIWGWK